MVDEFFVSGGRNVVSARSFLDALRGNNATPLGVQPAYADSARLGTIWSGHTGVGGYARVQFDGEGVASMKSYPSITSYVPKAGDRVMLLPHGHSYVIVGRISPTATQWTNLSLQSSWVQYDTGNASPQYMRTSDGTVKVKGLIKNGLTTADSVIATLPVGFRPSRQLHIATTANLLHAVVGVQATGNIVFKTGSNVWFSLDSVSFMAEQ